MMFSWWQKLSGSFLISLGIFYFHAAPAEKVFVQTLDTPRTFPKIESKAEWQKHAAQIRQQILVSCGLWPMPEKTPLRTRVFGKIIRDGYSIEKVYFQTYPGFYLAGNLYRPTGRGNGPFPAILNPHGHWANGRMADTKDGSIVARCINFARQGMMAFSYDMVGYNDTFFAGQNNSTNINFYNRHRQFATNESNLLWNISLLGLQTWNSIRALDFLESLADADKKRLACTGESGGGTQTFILGAIDDRLAAQAPVVMVSHLMQGGCSCENVSGLRIEYSNMEIAATAAPRPQLLVSATGDWTKDTLTVEGPALEKIYQFFGATNQFGYVQFDFPHNYNKTSREAVYDFFGKILKPISPSSKEVEYKKETDADLRVFPDGKLPSDAVSEKALIHSLIANDFAQWNALKPTDKKTFAKYKKVMTPLWKHTLQLVNQESRDFEITFAPKNSKARGTVVLARANGSSAFIDENKNPRGLAKLLFERNFQVSVLNFPDVSAVKQNQADLFFTTYNRTFAQERVRDLVAACERAKKSGENVILCGMGRAGLWSLLAAPAADAVIADCDQLDISSDAELLKPDLFIPGFRKMGGFKGVASLSAPHPVFLHNTNEEFSTNGLTEVYRSVRVKKNLRIEKERCSDEVL
ncbi:MAG: alpha/beta hydrolase family protein, partial [Verrucomicrobiota bacterium]|nr:alpha/beta hydrolase family protein [Verrucomicrobiota bacterium]